MSIFNIKQSFILYQTFGNIYSIAGFPYLRKVAKDCGKCIQQAPIWRPILLTRTHLLLALFLCHLSQNLILFRTLERVWFSEIPAEGSFNVENVSPNSNVMSKEMLTSISVEMVGLDL